MNTDGEEGNKIVGDQNLEGSRRTSGAESEKSEKKIKSRTPSIVKTQDFDADGVSLMEDDFAQYYDADGTQHQIKRFTWKNKNHIQIEVISYGARVISIKLPDRNGEIEDVLLGFDDLAGYLFYDKFYFGSVIGRVSNVIKNSTFVVENKKFTVNSNLGKHSIHGGFKGFDKAVWDTYVTGRKVIMSHISPHLSEGYPGNLLVRVMFELSGKNEFRVNFDVQTTRPTCVDLSHLLYFNLAGHHAGPDEVYRHILTLNCNCFTPEVGRIPTGEIFNVIHTQYDFQIPKILGKVMGVVPKDGFDQNLCVNRGMYQGECFVGRLLHPPTGRMMEVYSNQPGVQLKTATDFGYGIVSSIDDLAQDNLKCKPVTSVDEKAEKVMLLFKKVHEKVVDLLKIDEQQNFEEIMQLIYKFSQLRTDKNDEPLTKPALKITQIQNEYLRKAKEIACENEETDDDCLDLKEILSGIMKLTEVTEPPSLATSKPTSVRDLVDRTSVSSKKSLGTTSGSNKVNVEKSAEKVAKEEVPSKTAQSSKSNTRRATGSLNTIPMYYRDSDQIRGKGRALYKTHGGIALQSQNYPNAVNLKHFPNTILNPGEVYKHDIVYRFWIRAGNPNKWIKRNLNETKLRANKK